MLYVMVFDEGLGLLYNIKDIVSLSLCHHMCEILQKLPGALTAVVISET